MNYLIGISGKSNHGKDSLALFLKDNFLNSYSIAHTDTICFADKLKRITADILDVDYHYVNDQDGKIKEIDHMGGITGRRADQIVGTDIARKIYPDVWVYHYSKRIHDAFHNNNNMIVFTPDVRFENEYEYIKNIWRYDDNIKPVLIRVFRPGFNIVSGVDHLSERSLDHINGWDYKVTADNLEHLKTQAGIIYKLIVKSN